MDRVERRRPPALLLVEDNDSDAALIVRMLDESRTVEVATQLSEAKTRLARSGIDAVLLDLNLPDSHGLDGLRSLVHAYPDLPIVVLTGFDDEDVGQRAVEEGAQDYIVKGQVDHRLLDRSLRFAVERKRAERALARLAAITSGLCDECGRRLMPTTPGTLES